MPDSSESAESQAPSSDPGGSTAGTPVTNVDAKKEEQSPPRQHWLLNVLLTFLLVTVAGGLITAFLQHRNDEQNATDEQRTTTLQTYIDNMRTLLLTPKTAVCAPRGEVAQVVRVQTLTTLASLDANRNKMVLQFLQDAGLITNGCINLSYADLSNDELSGADLSGAYLNGAILTGAHLSGADLSGATLFGANLSGADLSGAQLNKAFLFGARLSNADLSGATLIDATLTGAFLGGTNMSRAILTSAQLNGAILQGANLNGAYLSAANLVDANLTDADLSGADISDANLSPAGFTSQQPGLTQQQVDEVHQCSQATLPHSLICPDITCTFVYTRQICQPSPPIQLTYWYTENPAEAPVIKSLINQFETKYPYIHINAVNTNYYQTETAFTNAAEEGNAPDVLRSDVGWVAEFASKGYLLPIDLYTSLDYLKGYLNGPYAGPLAYDRWAGQLYGLPQVTDFLALLYNKAELNQALNTTSPPSNMSDFEQDALKIAQKIPRTYGFETPGTGYNVLPFLYAFGGGMFDTRGDIAVANTPSVDGLEFVLALEKMHNVMHVNFTSGPVSPLDIDFAAGKTAMIFGGPYDVKEILTAGFNAKNLGIAAIPACPPPNPAFTSTFNFTPTCRPGQTTGSPSGGQSYVISAGTTHPTKHGSSSHS
jgi:uncharacterized protein YjbI with pentapeptide repeats/ABC-type glycerol-3-phosphate transport system substrate-binding protein